MNMGRVMEAVGSAFMFLVVSLGLAVGLASMILGPIGIAHTTLPLDVSCLSKDHSLVFIGGGWFLIMWAAASVNLYHYPKHTKEEPTL